MFHFLGGLKDKCRGMTDEEYVVLQACAAERRTLSLEERIERGAPEEADATFAGAVLWSWIVLWQDRPVFVALGIGGAVVSIGLKVWALF